MPPPDLGDLTLILGIFMAALPLPVKSVVIDVEVKNLPDSDLTEALLDPEPLSSGTEPGLRRGHCSCSARRIDGDKATASHQGQCERKNPVSHVPPRTRVI